MEFIKRLYREVDFSNILKDCLVLYAVCLILLYAVLRNNELFDHYTALLTLVLVGVLYASLSWKRQYAPEHTILLTTFIAVFFLARIISYLLFPTLHLEIPRVFNAANINTAMTFIVLGVAAMVAGFKVADALWKILPGKRAANNNAFPNQLSPHALALIWLIIAFIELYFMLYRGGASWNLSGIEEKPISGIWLIHIFSTDAIGIVTISIMAQQRDWYRKYKTYLLILVAFYLIIMLLLGSRGGALRVGTILLCALLARYGDFKTTYRKVMLFFILMIAISVAQFPLGTLLRYVNMGSSVTQSKALISKDNPVAFQIINRIGILDYPVAIISQQGNKAILDKYVTFRYSIKNIANNMVIGTPYPEHNIMTSRIFSAAYRGYSEEHIKRYFMSEPFTGWGISYILFGYGGGLVFLFFLAVMSQTAFNLIGRYMNGYQYVARSYFIFASTLAGLFMNFGIDHWITFIVYSILAFITTISMLVCLQFFFTKFSIHKAAFAL